MAASIHQEIIVAAAPQRVYDALTEARQFSALSGGAPAEIEAKAGGAFTLFGGQIEGRMIELVPGKRVVQAWRAKSWEPGVYSICRFALAAENSGTRISFDQVGFPDGQEQHLTPGWHKMYWEPLKAYLA